MTSAGTCDGPEVTVIFPCLDEEEAIGDCIDAAKDGVAAAGIRGEILVIDNGSTDRSAEIARDHGARVVMEERRGYGSAYLRGIQEARGEHLVMLDADGTYPAEMIGQFLEPLIQGTHDMVLGDRFAGMMADDAMPWANRYVGNPILSMTTRLLFRLPLRDMHCGMRAVRTDSVRSLGLITPGMEFATEMIVKALDSDLRVHELGIPYRHRVGPSKLMPLRDAWRHLEYMLVFSPGLLFLLPGTMLFALGLAIQLILVTGPVSLFGHAWDVHTNLGGLVLSSTGATLLGLGAVATAYAWSIGMKFKHSAVSSLVARAGDRPWRYLGLAAFACGVLLWGLVVLQWVDSGFGDLAAIPQLSLGTTFVATGVEMLGVAFIVHLIGLRS